MLCCFKEVHWQKSEPAMVTRWKNKDASVAGI